MHVPRSGERYARAAFDARETYVAERARLPPE